MEMIPENGRERGQRGRKDSWCSTWVGERAKTIGALCGGECHW